MLTDLFRRWRDAFPPPPEPATPLAGGDPDSLLVDSGTQTFWSRSAGTTSTLVEISGPDAGAQSVGRRVAAMLAAQNAPAPVAARAQVELAADPGAVEGRLVELLREEGFEEAYALLAIPCQERWGSARAFAAGHGASARNLLGLLVREVRYLAEWSDAEGGCVHRDVAELDVDYRVRLAGSRTATVSRTVHLVATAGGWRSICYPPTAASR